jgi:TRAP-type C4-dicarboxylate transport system substrate-binding protein
MVRLIVLFALIFSASAPPAGAVQRLVLAHAGEAGSMQALTAQEFSRRLRERLDGKIAVEVFGEGALGNENFIIQKVRDGDIDLVIVTAIMSSVSDEFGAFELPYLVLSREHVAKVRNQLLKSYFRPAARKSGLEVISLWDDGFRHVTMTNKAIVTPRDFDGVTLQVPQGEWRLRLFRTLGANATPQDTNLKLKDARRLVELGVVDGREMSLSQIQATQFFELQPHLSLTRHVFAPMYLVGGFEKFASLAPSVQDAIQDVARDMEDWTAQVSAAKERAILADLKTKVQVNFIDQLDFLMVSLPIYQDFGRLVPRGKEIVKLLYDPASFLQAGTAGER